MEDKLNNFRLYRESVLKATDFIFVTDSPYTDEIKEVIASYRQSLRDYPNTLIKPLDTPEILSFLNIPEFNYDDDDEIS